MANIRMNEDHRNFLFRLAKERVRCPVEEAADKSAYAKAAKLVKAMALAKWPERDMKVLAKYTQTEPVSSLRLKLTAGGIVQFEFRGEKEGPLGPASRPWNQIHEADKETSEAVSVCLSAKAALDKARDTKLEDYRSLIWASTNLEQIETVWPMAAELRPRVGRSLPVTLSNDVIARIKADAKTMAVAA